MRAKTIDIDPANVNTTGYDSGLTGAGPWTITTQNSGDGLAHQVGVGSTSDIQTIILTLTGTDADSFPQTDTVTGINNGTVETTKYFKTLTTISASATIGGATLNVGWVDEVASQTIPLDHFSRVPASVEIDITNAMNFDIEVSMRNPWDTGITDQESRAWVNDGNFTSKSADIIDDLMLAGLRAARIVVNSYTDTAELQAYMTFPKE
jgi:hypothetical protein